MKYYYYKMESYYIQTQLKKTNILSNQFQSAFSEKSEFTKTDFQKRCNMTNTSYPTIQDLNITENGIAKLLSNLNPCKAAGPDSITSRVLIELSTDIDPFSKLSSNGPMIPVTYQSYGKMQM